MVSGWQWVPSLIPASFALDVELLYPSILGHQFLLLIHLMVTGRIEIITNVREK